MSQIGVGIHLSSSSDSDGDDTRAAEVPVSSKTISPGKHKSGAQKYAPAIQKMMKMMGHEEGRGLGKTNQGRVEPVEATSIKGRRGLGTKFPKELEPGPVDWDFEEEVIVIQEKISWIPPPEYVAASTSIEELKKGLKIGMKREIIEDEINFIDSKILKGILRAKTMLDYMEGQELMRARSRSNPFETIRKGIFINRAAMKMANIDAIMDFELTDPKNVDGTNMVETNKLLYFADVCAGPGGFSEYVLWRKTWLSKGFGFTLKGDCDFKLDDFVSGPTESFEPHYGVHDDGDIYNPENVQSFTEYVLSNTNGLGVHFMMADGGFSVEGKENIQELLSKQLYISQALVAMGIVRTGGHFMCKLFDIFTPFSVGLVYLMYLSFEMVSLVKPNTSRPANSERYLVCKWKKEKMDGVFEYLKDCHQLMWQWSKALGEETRENDIVELVPLSVITDPDSEFFNYVLQSNNENGNRQIQNLKKIHAFFRDPSLKETRQYKIRLDSLDYWGIPGFRPDNKSRMVDRFTDSLHTFNTGFDLRRSNIETALTPTRAWKFTVVEGKRDRRTTGFYIGTGRCYVKRLEGSFWKDLQSYERFELSKDTLVYGEIVYEVKGEMPNQEKKAVFHIIDGFVLGGKDISKESFEVRQELCATFAEAMNKGVSGLASVRTKQFYPLSSMPDLFPCLRRQTIKGDGKREKLVCPIDLKDDNSALLQPSGILFINVAQEFARWTIEFSNSKNREYWFNSRDGTSQFEMPSYAITDSSHAIRTRINWWWDDYTNLNPEDSPSSRSQQEEPSDRLHAYDVLQHISTRK